MPDTILNHPADASPIDWTGDLTRVPFGCIATGR